MDDTDYYDEAIYHAEDLHYFDFYIPNFIEVWESCMQPTILQIIQYMTTFFIWNFLFRITSQSISLSHQFKHLTSIICGMAIAYFVLGIDALYVLGFTTITYLLFVTISRISQKNYGKFIAFFCLTSLTVGEMLATDSLIWHRMRGTQMIAACKIISLSFDIDRKKINRIPSFLEFWGYILCPGNIIMGPWCSFSDYLQIYQHPRWSFKWIGHIGINAVFAVSFLIASNCLVNGFIIDFNLRWIVTYKAALTYRCSHYFICFLSHCTMLLAGFGSGSALNANKNEKLQNFGYSITKPWIIESPRSLVDVVVYWNLSMHYWLKTYIFQQVKPYGIFFAVLFTYIISSLLHGINVQLAAVLLSLGFATYTEYTIRKKLSDIYNACILAHSCRSDCKHRYKSNNLYVVTFNIVFGLLAVFHLAYLGVMFDAPVEQQEVGYSFNHVMNKWGELNFLSHWMILIMFGINFLV